MKLRGRPRGREIFLNTSVQKPLAFERPPYYITKQLQYAKATLPLRGVTPGSTYLFTTEPLMKHSIALVTGTTSGLGYAAARLLAAQGYREVIVTGRSQARVQETAAQLAAETHTRVFTPLQLDLDTPSSVQSALAELVKRGLPIDFLLLNAGMVGGKKRVLTAAGIEAAQAPLIGHHQLTVGLLRPIY